MNENNNNSEKQTKSSVVVKPKGKCAEFAVKIAGPMVIDGDGKPRDAYKPALHAAYKGLQRFIEAQDKWNTYDKALEEVKNGKKETHWIWFIFPQLYGLGESEMSQFYGLDGREEAKAYIENDTLRTRLIKITEAVLNSDKSVYEIFGNDAIKVCSCMMLFASVSNEPVFKQVINKFSWK